MMLKQVLGEYYFVADIAMYFIWSGGSCWLWFPLCCCQYVELWGVCAKVF